MKTGICYLSFITLKNNSNMIIIEKNEYVACSRTSPVDESLTKN